MKAVSLLGMSGHCLASEDTLVDKNGKFPTCLHFDCIVNSVTNISLLAIRQLFRCIQVFVLSRTRNLKQNWTRKHQDPSKYYDKEMSNIIEGDQHVNAVSSSAIEGFEIRPQCHWIIRLLLSTIAWAID